MQQTESASPSPNERARDIVENVSKVIVGKTPVIEQALAALLAQGHILVEDVPGVGKTMLAKSLAASLGCQFKRIQFTPDLLPSDITGTSIYNQNTREFEFRPGPVMAQVVLADEINRATPKTQSALLEAMEEWQVSVDGVTHYLGYPFIVLATQNPIEYEGTFPLPEAQLDRFLIRVSLGYPDFAEELAVIEGQERIHPIEKPGGRGNSRRRGASPGGGAGGLRGRAGAGIHRGAGRGHPQPPGRGPGRVAPGFAGDVSAWPAPTPWCRTATTSSPTTYSPWPMASSDTASYCPPPPGCAASSPARWWSACWNPSPSRAPPGDRKARGNFAAPNPPRLRGRIVHNQRERLG